MELTHTHTLTHSTLTHSNTNTYTPPTHTHTNHTHAATNTQTHRDTYTLIHTDFHSHTLTETWMSSIWVFIIYSFIHEYLSAIVWRVITYSLITCHKLCERIKMMSTHKKYCNVRCSVDKCCYVRIFLENVFLQWLAVAALTVRGTPWWENYSFFDT